MVADVIVREVIGPTGRMRIRVKRRGLFGLRCRLEREVSVRHQPMNPYAPKAEPRLEWQGASLDTAEDATFIFEPIQGHAPHA